MMDAAIVGLGRWGEALVNSVQGKSDKIRFVRAVTRTPAKARDFAAKAGIPVDSDYDAALKDPAVRAIVLATPHTQHADQIIAAARAGKHVFVEKPFALTRATAEQALEAAQKAKITVGVGHNRRFLPALIELKRMAASRELGPLLHVEGIFAVNIGGPNDAWRNSRAESPAGGMTSLGIHALDLMIGLAGPVTEVTAMSQRRAIAWDIDDTTVMLFRHKSGATGYLCTLAQGARLIMVRAFGPKGWAEMHGERQLIRCMAPPSGMGGEEQKTDYPAFDSLNAELEAFAAAASGGPAFPITPVEIVNGVAVLEAIDQSAREKRTITID
jgi:predicted dehydrogenase